jgi:hypothetical protein
MRNLDLSICGVEEMNEEQMMKTEGGGFLDGLADGGDGTVDRNSYAKDFWYTVGWGIGKSLRDQVM